MPPSIEHLQTKKSQEIIVALDRTPAFVRMMIQNRQTDLLQRAVVSGRRPGMINHPVRSAFAVSQRVSNKNHDVVRKLLDPRLVKKQQVSTLSATAIASYKCAVEIFERAGVGKLGKLPTCKIRLLKRTEFGTESLSTERIRRQRKSLNIRSDR